MRRLALSVLTACGLAILSACSGGTGLETGSGTDASVPTSIAFFGDSGQLNDFFVAPTYTSPVSASQALAVTAVANKGAGPTAIVVPNATFTWGARFATAADPPGVNTYLFGPTPNGYKTCGFLAAGAPTPAIPIYVQEQGSRYAVASRALRVGAASFRGSRRGRCGPVLYRLARNGFARPRSRLRHGRRFQQPLRPDGRISKRGGLPSGPPPF